MSVEQTTILVIEDEKDILELITFNLKMTVLMLSHLLMVKKV